MKVSSSSSILSLALAFSGAMASPLRARGYQYYTVTEYATEIVHVTSTAWVDPAQYGPTEVPTPTPDPQEKNKNHVPMSTPSTTSSIPSTTTSTTSKSIPTTTSSPTTSPPTKHTPKTTIPPTTLETSTSPVPTTTPTPPEPSTSAPAPVPTAPVKAPAGGSSGSFTGEATYFNTGMGACGVQSQDSDMMVALAAPDFDPTSPSGNPNKNSLCGKSILVSYKGGPEVACKILDRCPECVSGAIDLSPAAFKAMGADASAGRVPVTWRYAQ